MAVVSNVRLELDAIKIRMLNEIDAIVASKQQTTIQRKKKNVSFKELTSGRTWVIETEADVDKYMAELRKKIVESIETDTTINIIN